MPIQDDVLIEEEPPMLPQSPEEMLPEPTLENPNQNILDVAVDVPILDDIQEERHQPEFSKCLLPKFMGGGHPEIAPSDVEYDQYKPQQYY